MNTTTNNHGHSSTCITIPGTTLHHRIDTMTSTPHRPHPAPPTIPATLVLAASILTACTTQDAPHDEADEIVENLIAAGFLEADILITDAGRVFVGGDAHVTLEASREMIGDDAASGDLELRQYRTNNLGAVTVKDICIDGSGLSGTLSAGLDGAIANYDGLDLSFSMRRTNGDDTGCDAEIIVQTSGTGTSAWAGFPSGGLPYGLVSIGTGVAGYGTAVSTHVLTHELGHCVGLRHTDYFDRSISCGGGYWNEGDAGIGAIHVDGTPTGASYNGSIMNACYNAGSSGVWSDGDRTALLELYPANVVVAGVAFAWDSAGPIPRMSCTQIIEATDPYTWNDNYFCASQDIGMVWSSAGPVAGMICTQIIEAADPHTWQDNYLCLPSTSDFRFRWSSAGSLGSNSVQWLETSDPHTWDDNFLQIAHTGDVCAGTLFADNSAAQAGCPGVCAAFGLSFMGNWTNAWPNVDAAGCQAGFESVCGCAP